MIKKSHIFLVVIFFVTSCSESYFSGTNPVTRSGQQQGSGNKNPPKNEPSSPEFTSPSSPQSGDPLFSDPIAKGPFPFNSDFCRDLNKGSLAASNSGRGAPPGSVLEDLVMHLPPSYPVDYFSFDKPNWGHENSHGLSSHIRNNLTQNPRGIKTNGFYMLGGTYATVLEPKIRKSAVGYLGPSEFWCLITG